MIKAVNAGPPGTTAAHRRVRRIRMATPGYEQGRASRLRSANDAYAFAGHADLVGDG
jgi:hypothetical protein